MRDFIDHIKFELKHTWTEFFMRPYLNIKNGIINFWIWRKIIWSDRWWDYDFLHRIIKFKLELMHSNWDKSMHVGWQREKLILTELIEILNEIEKTEDDWHSLEDDKKIDKLYEKFGHKLFNIVKWNEEYNNQKIEKQGSQIRRFWD